MWMGRRGGGRWGEGEEVDGEEEGGGRWGGGEEVDGAEEYVDNDDDANTDDQPTIDDEKGSLY